MTGDSARRRFTAATEADRDWARLELHYEQMLQAEKNRHSCELAEIEVIHQRNMRSWVLRYEEEESERTAV